MNQGPPQNLGDNLEKKESIMQPAIRAKTGKILRVKVMLKYWPQYVKKV